LGIGVTEVVLFCKKEPKNFCTLAGAAQFRLVLRTEQNRLLSAVWRSDRAALVKVTLIATWYYTDRPGG
jgi:hypothetical protein